MQDPSSERREGRLGFAARIDRAARDMNAFLFVLAVGLAALDLSCYWALKLRDALPPVRPTAIAAAVPETGFAAAQPGLVQPR
ncbi:MAG TPA: hypothetical protein VHU15_16470 [Stellaceae bacterium]|jgi:hypothetical protein|nr:hypothetical protein [Stellaceae bacterium]